MSFKPSPEGLGVVGKEKGWGAWEVSGSLGAGLMEGKNAVPLAIAAPLKEIILGTPPPDSSQDLVSRKQVKSSVPRM